MLRISLPFRGVGNRPPHAYHIGDDQGLRPMSPWSNSEVESRSRRVRFIPMNGHRQTRPTGPKSARFGSDKPYSITSSVLARRDYRSTKSHRRRAQAYRPPIRYGSRVLPAALVIDLDQQSDFSRREYAGYLCNFMGEKNVGSCSIRSQAEPRN